MLKKITLALDLAGCPNRCRHCWLGWGPNGGLSREELERYLNSIAQEVVRRLAEGLSVTRDVPEPDRELIIDFYKCGLSGMVMAWVGEGMKADPEQMIRSLGALLKGSIASAMEKGRQRAGRKKQ